MDTSQRESTPSKKFCLSFQMEIIPAEKTLISCYMESLGANWFHYEWLPKERDTNTSSFIKKKKKKKMPYLELWSVAVYAHITQTD